MIPDTTRAASRLRKRMGAAFAELYRAHGYGPDLGQTHQPCDLCRIIERELAALRADQHLTPDNLDTAWMEAHLTAYALFGEQRYIAFAGPEPGLDSRSAGTYRAECGVDFAVRNQPTPVAALQALTAKLTAALPKVGSDD